MVAAVKAEGKPCTANEETAYEGKEVERRGARRINAANNARDT
jgi:hypothetical protein